MKKILVVLVAVLVGGCAHKQPVKQTQAQIDEQYKFAAEQEKKYLIEHAKEIKEANEKKQADKIAEEKKQKEYSDLLNRIENYKQLKSPTQAQQMQQLVDLQQLQVINQEKIAKQADSDKKQAEQQKAQDQWNKALYDAEHYNDLNDSLDRALRKDHINRKLGIY